MRYVPRAALAGVLGLAASLLVACGGGSGMLSAGQARTLSTQLDQLQSAASAGDCARASSAAGNFANTVQSLGAVKSQLADNLKQGAAALSGVTSRSCKTSSTTTTTSFTTTSSPTSTTTTTSSPTITTTSTPTSTSSATTSSDTGTSQGGQGSGGGGISRGSGGGNSGSGRSSGGAGIGSGNGNGNGNGNGQ